MSQPVSSLMIAIVGGLTVLVVVILVIQQMAGISIFNANTSTNLVSSGQGLSELLVVFAMILGVGTFGFIVQKR